MNDDLVKTTDDAGREVWKYAKGKAPKVKPRYSTRPLVGGETPAPAEKPAPSKQPEKE